MFARGLVAETENLLQRGLGKNPTAMQAIGYRQVVEYLRGQRALPETIELVKIRTRQFAKRQMTWFRRQLNLKWIPLDDENFQNVAAGIATSFVETTQVKK
jgi:tRNA dimethylallyltransferase